jgi:uncharacterized membrane protein YdjX (TVP38/TMEM64 family)
MSARTRARLRQDTSREAASAALADVNDRRSWLVPALTGLTVVVGCVLLWSAWRSTSVQTWKAEAGVVPFFAVMALVPALGVPMTPFFLLAGATFGERVGIIGSLTALALNLILCYELAGSKLRPLIARLFRRLGYALPDLDEAEGKRALRFTLFVKAAPGLPAWAKNYVLGMARVPFPVYFVVSMVVTGLYGAAVIVLGDSVLGHDVDRSVVVAGAVVLAAAVVWWARRRSRLQADLRG